MITVSILVPVLGRPQNVGPLVDSIWAGTPGVAFEVVFITSLNDRAEIRAIEHAADRHGPVVQHQSIPGPFPGDYARKINWAYAHTESEWLFLGADDIRFHSDWFNKAVDCSRRTGRRVVGTQDLGNSRVLKGEHSTHTLVQRSYVDEHGTIDEPGKVLHESYPHEFVDDEFIETAKLRDEFVFCNESVVEHLHPIWGKAPTDRLYLAHNKRMNQGRRIYQKRKPLWTSR